MNIRNLQAGVEASDASKWDAIVAEDAWQAALECEAEAIASRRIGDLNYVVSLLHSGELEPETVIDQKRNINWAALQYMRMFSDMTRSEFIETLAKWVMWRDDVMREARANIEGDAFDNLYDADDRWAD